MTHSARQSGDVRGDDRGNGASGSAHRRALPRHPRRGPSNGAALTAEIERWTGEREKREVMKAFAGRGIVCGAVLDTAEVLARPASQGARNDLRP